jgi:putative iron-dependent peroxidase
VAGFGAQLWRSVAPSATPVDLTPFETITGRDGHLAPAVQHDAWLWLSGAEPDVTWQSARAAVLAVRDAAHLAVERPAFTYRGGRDLTGFIDGTANPPVRLAANVALVPPGHAGQGRSHVLTMRWVHDLVAFDQLSVNDQQRVIGRTKADSIELSGAGSHRPRAMRALGARTDSCARCSRCLARRPMCMQRIRCTGR